MIRLGLRIGFSRNRWSMAGNAIIAVIVALVIAVLLLGSSMANAWDKRADRGAWQLTSYQALDSSSVDNAGNFRPPGPDTAMVARNIYTDDGPRPAIVYAFRMVSEGHTAPIPPGIPELPRSGESYASPAMQRKLSLDEHLRHRFPHVVGTIAESALRSPDTLVIVTGGDPVEAAKPNKGTSVDYFRVRHFPATAAQVPDGYQIDSSPIISGAIVLVAGIMILPLLYLLFVTSKLGADIRLKQEQALSLAGASAVQIRQIRGASFAIPALAGVALGWLAYSALRYVAANVTIDGDRWWVADIVSPPPLAAAISLLVPLVAILLATNAVRVRRDRDPESNNTPSASSERGRPSRWRLITIALPVIFLAPHVGLFARFPSGFGVFVAVFCVVAVLIFITPLLIDLFGRVLARKSGYAGLLSGKSLITHSRAMSRAIAPLSVSALIGTLFLVFTPTELFGGGPDLLDQLRLMIFGSLAVIFTISALGLIASTYFGLLERRRAYTLLRATGTPMPQLYKALFLETVVPAAALCFGTWLIAFVLSGGIWWTSSLPTVYYLLTVAKSALPALLAVTLTALVALAFLPLVERITRPQTVSFE